MLQPSLGVSSLTWAALRGGLFFGSDTRVSGLQWEVDSPAPKVRMTAPSFPPAAHHALFGDVFPALSRRALGGRAERACRRGSFVTLPALVLAGLDPRAANITSTVALFPGQVTSGLAARSLVSGAQHLSFRALFAISLIGGALGAILLLATPVVAFARMVPWLVLSATVMFAWGSFARRPSSTVPLGPVSAGVIQFLIAIYGGYFGGGIGFLMLSALTVAGLPVRSAGATKNVLSAVMNASAVTIFVFSPEVHWLEVLALGAGSILGGLGGAWMLHRVPELFLRFFVIAIGTILTIALFLRPV